MWRAAFLWPRIFHGVSNTTHATAWKCMRCGDKSQLLSNTQTSPRTAFQLPAKQKCFICPTSLQVNGHTTHYKANVSVIWCILMRSEKWPEGHGLRSMERRSRLSISASPKSRSRSTHHKMTKCDRVVSNGCFCCGAVLAVGEMLLVPPDARCLLAAWRRYRPARHRSSLERRARSPGSLVQCVWHVLLCIRCAPEQLWEGWSIVGRRPRDRCRKIVGFIWIIGSKASGWFTSVVCLFAACPGKPFRPCERKKALGTALARWSRSPGSHLSSKRPSAAWALNQGRRLVAKLKRSLVPLTLPLDRWHTEGIPAPSLNADRIRHMEK